MKEPAERARYTEEHPHLPPAKSERRGIFAIGRVFVTPVPGAAPAVPPAAEAAR